MKLNIGNPGEVNSTLWRAASADTNHDKHKPRSSSEGPAIFLSLPDMSVKDIFGYVDDIQYMLPCERSCKESRRILEDNNLWLCDSVAVVMFSQFCNYAAAADEYNDHDDGDGDKDGGDIPEGSPGSTSSLQQLLVKPRQSKHQEPASYSVCIFT